LKEVEKQLIAHHAERFYSECYQMIENELLQGNLN